MRKYLNLRATIALGIAFTFLLNAISPMPVAQADVLLLPQPGAMIALSPSFNPPILKGLKVHPNQPFKFDFILDEGEGGHAKAESTKLIKYFLAALSIPEQDLWVNLSPYEKDRIIPQDFGLTEMGRDLLAQDYILKQITASLIYPEGAVGKKFWKKIYEEAAQKFGTTNVPVNTFNKVWIVPDKAVVYENEAAGTAYVVDAKLKVMLEEDYLSAKKHTSFLTPGVEQVLREIVIPQLNHEVNFGANFSRLRQVYNSLILATWYKKKIRDSILEKVYANKNKIAGTGYNDTNVQMIYQRYLEAFKKGVYNYIKDDTDPLTQQPTPRKYFSGGMDDTNLDAAITATHTLPSDNASLVDEEVNFNPAGQSPDSAQFAIPFQMEKLIRRGKDEAFFRREGYLFTLKDIEALLNSSEKQIFRKQLMELYVEDDLESTYSSSLRSKGARSDIRTSFDDPRWEWHVFISPLGELIGAMCYSRSNFGPPNSSSAYLSDLQVKRKYRDRNIGRFLVFYSINYFALNKLSYMEFHAERDKVGFYEHIFGNRIKFRKRPEKGLIRFVLDISRFKYLPLELQNFSQISSSQDGAMFGGTLKGRLEHTAVAFAPSGYQGPGMGKDLYDAYPEIRALYARVNDTARIVLNDKKFDVREYSFDASKDELAQHVIGPQLARLTYEIALWEIYEKEILRGQKPKMLLGISLGLLPAFVVSGVLTLEDAVTLLIKQTAFHIEAARMTGNRRMAVINFDSGKMAAILKDFPYAEITIPISNKNYTISASENDLAQIKSRVRAQGGSFYDARLPITSHDSHLGNYKGPAKDGFKKFIDTLPFQTPNMILYSNVDPEGKILKDPEDIRRDYWQTQISPIPLDQILPAIEKQQGITHMVMIGAKDFLRNGIDVEALNTNEDIQHMRLRDGAMFRDRTKGASQAQLNEQMQDIQDYIHRGAPDRGRFQKIRLELLKGLNERERDYIKEQVNEYREEISLSQYYGGNLNDAQAYHPIYLLLMMSFRVLIQMREDNPEFRLDDQFLGHLQGMIEVFNAHLEAFNSGLLLRHQRYSKFGRLDLPFFFHLPIGAVTRYEDVLVTLSERFKYLPEGKLKDQVAALDVLLIGFHFESNFTPGVDDVDFDVLTPRLEYLARRLSGKGLDKTTRREMEMGLGKVLYALSKFKDEVFHLPKTKDKFLAIVPYLKTVDGHDSRVEKILEEIRDNDLTAKVSFIKFEIYTTMTLSMFGSNNKYPSDIVQDFWDNGNQDLMAGFLSGVLNENKWTDGENEIQRRCNEVLEFWKDVLSESPDLAMNAKVEPIDGAMGSNPLIDNTAMRHIGSMSEEKRNLIKLIELFLQPGHPLKKEIFDEINQWSDEQIINEMNRILRKPVDPRVREPLQLYGQWTVRKLILLPTSGDEDIYQELATHIGNITTAEAINDFLDVEEPQRREYREKLIRLTIKHYYLLLKSIEIVSRRPDLFHPEDSHEDSPYYQYLISSHVITGNGRRAYVRPNIVRNELSSSSFLIWQLLGPDVIGHEDEITVEQLVEAMRIKKENTESIRSFLEILNRLDQNMAWKRSRGFLNNLKNEQEIEKQYERNIDKLQQALAIVDQAMNSKRFETFDAIQEVLPHVREGGWFVAFDADRNGYILDKQKKIEVVQTLNQILFSKLSGRGLRYFSTRQVDDDPQKEEGIIYFPEGISQEEILDQLRKVRGSFQDRTGETVTFAAINGPDLGQYMAKDYEDDGLKSLKALTINALARAKGNKTEVRIDDYGNKTVFIDSRGQMTRVDRAMTTEQTQKLGEALQNYMDSLDKGTRIEIYRRSINVQHVIGGVFKQTPEPQRTEVSREIIERIIEALKQASEKLTLRFYIEGLDSKMATNLRSANPMQDQKSAPAQYLNEFDSCAGPLLEVILGIIQHLPDHERYSPASFYALLKTWAIFHLVSPFLKGGFMPFYQAELMTITQQMEISQARQVNNHFTSWELAHTLGVEEDALTALPLVEFEEILRDRAMDVEGDSIDSIIHQWAGGDTNQTTEFKAEDGRVFEFKLKAAENAYTILVFSDAQEIGYIDFEIVKNNPNDIYATMEYNFLEYGEPAIWVSERFRKSSKGSYKGIGRSLLGIAERLAYLRGAKKYYAVNIEEPNFVNFYSPLGYKFVNHEPVPMVYKYLDPSNFSPLGIKFDQAMNSSGVQQAISEVISDLVRRLDTNNRIVTLLFKRGADQGIEFTTPFDSAFVLESLAQSLETRSENGSKLKVKLLLEKESEKNLNLMSQAHPGEWVYWDWAKIWPQSSHQGDFDTSYMVLGSLMKAKEYLAQTMSAQVGRLLGLPRMMRQLREYFVYHQAGSEAKIFSDYPGLKDRSYGAIKTWIEEGDEHNYVDAIVNVNILFALFRRMNMQTTEGLASDDINMLNGMIAFMREYSDAGIYDHYLGHYYASTQSFFYLFGHMYREFEGARNAHGIDPRLDSVSIERSRTKVFNSLILTIPNAQRMNVFELSQTISALLDLGYRGDELVKLIALLIEKTNSFRQQGYPFCIFYGYQKAGLSIGSTDVVLAVIAEALMKYDAAMASDRAMRVGQLSQVDKGGIDLTSTAKTLEAQSAGIGIKFHMDAAQLAEFQNAPGLVPVIVSWKPITNLRGFLQQASP